MTVISLLPTWCWRNAHQNHELLCAFVAHPMWHAARCPNRHARACRLRFLTDDKLAYPFQHKIKLVLIIMRMHMLRLTRFKAIETQQQLITAKEGSTDFG